MDWEQILPPLADSDSDDIEIDRRLRQSLRLPAAPSQKDIEQDAMIRSLKRETQELRIYVAALVRLLAQKETIDPAEVEELIALADRVRHEIRPRQRSHHSKVGGLIYPPEAA